MSFLHIQSYQQSTEESSHPLNSKLNFVNIQAIDLKPYKKKWRLLFNNVPSLKILESIYYDLQGQSIEDRETKEMIFLQCILLNMRAPLNLKLNEEQWIHVNELMPTHKTSFEWSQMCQQFLHQSAYNNPWSENEDKLLLDIILSFQRMKKGNKWSKIARELNERSLNKFIRTPKQCRERWGNKLDPSINRNEWTDLEDLNFLQLLLQHGRRWAELSIRLSPITNNKKRTEFSLKHRFKKLISSINSIESRSIHGTRYAISSDWNNKEISKLLCKISQLEMKTNQKEVENFYYHPLTKQIKFNDFNKLVIIKGSSKVELDLSILFNQTNSQLND
ncbi:unnamed protein product [Paramecium pentaurelia]|uniref:Myb-like DNA-binding domain containing protein n=1 Tax=Paramecium pentaurelia TaxID=43138 RepID=A0A8S1Y145_9CILI|nr:unnamed protein product [Paramecium pentaurelia]